MVLSVNPNTISKVYRELEIQDILETHQGTGTFIGSKPVRISPKERHAKLKGICDEFITAASSYGFTVGDLMEELVGRKEERHAPKQNVEVAPAGGSAVEFLVVPDPVAALRRQMEIHELLDTTCMLGA